jgi:membrane carboxypeptidase/penicillin-binding protein PbpC
MQFCGSTRYNERVKKIIKKFGKVLLITCILFYIGSYFLSKHILDLYASQTSDILQDRNGTEILIQPNVKGQYMRPAASVPREFTDLLITKEDKFFFYHVGINPISILRSFIKYPFTLRFEGSSTLTQQLVKTLLGNENNRNVSNKLVESFYTISLELHTSKQQLLKMYANTAYFGNQAEGVVEASKTYFNVPPESLSTTQILELLTTLNSPNNYPGTERNKNKTIALAKILNISLDEKILNEKAVNRDEYSYRRKNINMFELGSLNSHCTKPCSLTIDESLTDTVREIVRTNLDSPSFSSVENGAVVVIRFNKKTRENELLAIVGSPHPTSPSHGYQINMATRPRPIGSTAKPFIYAKTFEKGARPYTQVEDMEYKYDIGTGFAFYPKNYDGKYRGTVTLHEALSNSLNVPAVRVLQYAGLDNFYSFLKQDLRFEPLQPLEKYELSIALGGLEMDLLTLGNYFTIFPNEGILKPLRLSNNDILKLPMAELYDAHQVFDSSYTQLVTKILSDRQTSIDQFGLKSNLNLPATNYALKTGTSYDYHDSWTIGYTPDFLVGVWLGNSDNKPMYKLSGSVGAGKVWHEVMETLLNSPYNQKTDFNFNKIKEYINSGSIEYGLEGDNYNAIRKLLETNNLILQPHNLDTLQYTHDMKVPFISSEDVAWYVNNVNLGTGMQYTWQPIESGTYTITAKTSAVKSEKITVIIKNEE